MQENARDLTAAQERAVVALLAESNVEAAAKACKLNPATIWRWLRTGAFRAAVQQARWEAFEQATNRIAAAAGQAAETLREALDNPDSSWQARVRAAQVILDHARESVELQDLEQRVTVLEIERGSER